MPNGTAEDLANCSKTFNNMLLLVIFAFIAGIVTILSPCILPILPIVLGGGISHDKKRPFGIITGFIASFTFFTLFLSAIVRIVGIPAESLRYFSIIVILLFGIGLILPQFQKVLEKLFSKLSSIAPKGDSHSGFFGGILIGLSIGLLWTPCVGPILASVISLALTGNVNGQAFFITLAYSLGTAIPMLGIMLTGRTIFQKVPWLLSRTAQIQKLFGILMILTAVGIWFNVDRKFQTFILDTFPQYGTGLTKFEDTDVVNAELDNLSDSDQPSLIQNKSSDYLPSYAAAPEIIPGGQWFNSDPLRIKDLRGKVVLIDFWTYTCINCQRTLPYLRDWNQKYKDTGLVIIGVHTPEFEFEKDPKNVTQALEDFEITYPIVQDNDYATWNAYSNRYWPAKYLIDKKGIVRYFHFGEGEYDETERAIQSLLESDSPLPEVNNPDYSIQTRTPELYLGHLRVEHLTSPEKILENVPGEYSYPQRQEESTFSFHGKWLIGREYAAPAKGSKLRLHFESKEVFLVARPREGNTEGVMRITFNEKKPDTEAGEDVENGNVTIKKDALYKLIHLQKMGQGILEIEFMDDHLELYAFTFG